MYGLLYRSLLAEHARAMRAELAPAGVLQHELVLRIAAGLWRARRSDRIEAALLARCLECAQGLDGETDLGRAVIRDASGPRALDVLLRYRGSAQAELFRALGALKALQAEAAAVTDVASPGPSPTTGEARRPAPAT